VRNKLSFYSVLLLVGLAVASGLIFFNNPFNGAPASAAPGAQTVANTGLPSQSSTSTATSSTALAPSPVASGFGGSSQSGGTSGGHHHHSDSAGGGGVTGNSTVTTTTSSIYSINE